MVGKKENETSRTLRFVTAASLFDGHDAAINVIRRLIQSKGAEVVHLGHNRSVCEVVRAAIQEDVDAIAISSYQGGHMEYFTYLLDLLKEYGAEHIKVFGGGGGTITLEEINILESAGVSRIYHPEQGMKMGLIGMIDDLFQIVRAGSTDKRTKICVDDHYERYIKQDINNEFKISQTISAIENRVIPADTLNELKTKWKEFICETPVIGITGTGGAGKSSVIDELLERFLRNRPDIRIAVLAVDPTRRKTGGALLGDRIRMNSLSSPKIFMRSMATRRQHLATNEVLEDISIYLRSVGYDLILIETAGIGQSDSQIVDFVDLSIYIMTGDYGAATQLEKIDMVDYADIVILNKYEKRGSADALRDIRKQWRRNHNKFDLLDTEIPVYPVIANQFNDPGLSYAFYNLCRLIARKKKLDKKVWVPKKDSTFIHSKSIALIPENRVRYLSDISENGRQICKKNKAQSELASEAYQAYSMLKKLKDEMLPSPLEKYSESQLIQKNSDKTLSKLRATYQYAITKMTMESKKIIHEWTERKSAVESDKYSYSVRGKDIKGDNYTTSLSQLKIPKVAAPKYRDWGEILKFLLSENLPGNYPYTAGVFSYRRIGEDPSRMFAGEGTPEKTNRRFHYVSSGLPAIRLSTAFDSVTLYGADPDVRPDIWGKIGNSGVSIATLDDMKKLYSGFDLCSSKTSVSMTINGPAPMILAFFMNAVIDQQVEIYLKENDLWAEAELKIQNFFKGKERPTYKGKLPDGHNQLGLAIDW
jgi:methylmalonyl-CoA mutase